MPRLTILIPCVGGAAAFDATLVSVLQHRPADCEVLLVHTEPYDDPYDLAGEVQFLRTDRSCKLVDLLNEGLADEAVVAAETKALATSYHAPLAAEFGWD